MPGAIFRSGGSTSAPIALTGSDTYAYHGYSVTSGRFRRSTKLGGLELHVYFYFEKGGGGRGGETEVEVTGDFIIG